MSSDNKSSKGFLGSKAFKQGISFGIISSTLTTLGLNVGMWASGGTVDVLIKAILGITVSDALADSFSIYMANKATGDADIALLSAMCVCVVEFILPLVFILPLIFMHLNDAIITNTIIGAVLVGGTGYYVSSMDKKDRNNILGRVMIYLGVLGAVLLLTTGSGELETKLEPTVDSIHKQFVNNK